MEESVAGGNSEGENGAGAKQGTKEEMLGFVAKVEAWLDVYMVSKAPFQIPMGGKEIFVKIAPYLIIIFVLLALPALLALLGVTAVFAPMAAVGGNMWGILSIISIVTSVVALVLEVMAVPGLFKRTRASWNLLFYATLVSFVGGVLSMNPIGAVVGGIIGWYILFQIKELYKN